MTTENEESCIRNNITIFKAKTSKKSTAKLNKCNASITLDKVASYAEVPRLVTLSSPRTFVESRTLA